MNHPGIFIPLFVLVLALASPVILSAQQTKITTLDELRAARSILAAKPRRLIANNDGCDCLYFPGKLEPSPKNFLDLRTTHLAGSQVGAISYCTISSGFGHFTHHTKVGTVLTRQGADYDIQPDRRNITADLIKQGTDPLEAVTEFAHEHGMESFWSMRMNDTHDVAHRPDKPYFLFPQMKVDHPEWLVGEPVKRTPQGRWSSVDYARPEIRELAFRYVEEVCRNYDVDGVELDFFRHLCYFKSVANGGKASAEEVAAMTALMRRIRTMTEDEGLKRQRPILVSMRLPDSAGFALDSGLDLATWLKEGLMDILITTDYFRLNPWEHSVKLGHEHGVKVYPALTDPRVKGETRFTRVSVPAYRARAATAWAAGADGLYLFNLYDLDPKSPLWRELGDPQALAFTDKHYFVDDLDGRRSSWLAGGDKYRTLPLLTPTSPASLNTKEPFKTQITVAEDLSAAAKSGRQTKATLHLELPGLGDPKRVQVSLNGATLDAGKDNKGWVDLPVASASLKNGVNDLTISLTPAAATQGDEWSITYEGGNPPAKPWLRDAGSARVHEATREGALLLADRGTQNGDYCYYRAPWGADAASESVVEALVKVESGTSYIIFSNGRSGERLQLSPSGIALHHSPKVQYHMNTTDDFHTYRITLKGTAVQVHVDGELRLDAPAALQTARGAMYPRNEVAFGAANSNAQGEALWKQFRFRAARTTQDLRDVVLSVSYQKQ
jgi:hypothetical protein